MRQFYYDEGPIDTLLQIAAKPVWDGDLVSKEARKEFVQLGWVERCQGWNVITLAGQQVIRALKLRRQLSSTQQAQNLHAAFIEHHVPWPFPAQGGERGR